MQLIGELDNHTLAAVRCSSPTALHTPYLACKQVGTDKGVDLVGEEHTTRVRV